MEHRSAIEVLLDQARNGLDRVEPQRIVDEMAAGAILVDIRPVEQRQRDGELVGAIIIDRNVLEWRLDPTQLIDYLSRQTAIFAMSWCATRGTVPASLRPHFVSLVCIGQLILWAAFRPCWRISGKPITLAPAVVGQTRKESNTCRTEQSGVRMAFCSETASLAADV
jgi:hypothetical protein